MPFIRRPWNVFNLDPPNSILWLFITSLKLLSSFPFFGLFCSESSFPLFLCSCSLYCLSDTQSCCNWCMMSLSLCVRIYWLWLNKIPRQYPPDQCCIVKRIKVSNKEVIVGVFDQFLGARWSLTFLNQSTRTRCLTFGRLTVMLDGNNELDVLKCQVLIENSFSNA